MKIITPNSALQSSHTFIITMTSSQEIIRINRINTLFLHPGAGYRFQKPERSLFLKAAMGPSLVLDPQAGDFWNMDPKVYFFGSVAGGINF
jgi:hypothetical protein